MGSFLFLLAHTRVSGMDTGLIQTYKKENTLLLSFGSEYFHVVDRTRVCEGAPVYVGACKCGSQRTILDGLPWEFTCLLKEVLFCPEAHRFQLEPAAV